MLVTKRAGLLACDPAFGWNPHMGLRGLLHLVYQGYLGRVFGKKRSESFCVVLTPNDQRKTRQWGAIP
ncbi:hypothetical protein Gocc_2114 [Gaiella occulta]|uniref:Uncharacterized protein n=1 Tax=Gaiella occulta TaxID=1002870 RepID=A0A7M2YX11_9ACTN|nr:hypothetical protein Gocc_2114 [Gaiella occulta]